MNKIKLILSIILCIITSTFSGIATVILALATNDMYRLLLSNDGLSSISTVCNSFYIGLIGTILSGIVTILTIISGAIILNKASDEYYNGKENP